MASAADLADIDAEREACAAFRRPQRQVMLHAIALEDRDAAVVPMDRAGHGDRALGVKQTVALILRDAQ